MLIGDFYSPFTIFFVGDFSYADAWLKEETLGYIPGTLSDGPLVYEGLNEQFLWVVYYFSSLD